MVASKDLDDVSDYPAGLSNIHEPTNINIAPVEHMALSSIRHGVTGNQTSICVMNTGQRTSQLENAVQGGLGIVQSNMVTRMPRMLYPKLGVLMGTLDGWTDGLSCSDDSRSLTEGKKPQTPSRGVQMPRFTMRQLRRKCFLRTTMPAHNLQDVRTGSYPLSDSGCWQCTLQIHWAQV